MPLHPHPSLRLLPSVPPICPRPRPRRRSSCGGLRWRKLVPPPLMRPGVPPAQRRMDDGDAPRTHRPEGESVDICVKKSVK